MLLETKDLVKEYGNKKNKVCPVNNVNLKIKRGDFIAIIGKSGTGKSTLMHILGGLEKPTFGKVLIDNEDIYALKEDDLTIYRRKNIGFIYQFYNLIPQLTVKENIILPVVLDEQKIDWNYFNKIIKILNLKDRLNYLPNELSGGGQQRVAIARALINKPKIILADEPTGNLDSKSSMKVIKLLRKLNKNYNQTIVMVTHDLLLAKKADKIIEYIDGKINDNTKNI